MKNSNDTVGNRARDLPTCNAVPQPTAPPHAPPDGPKECMPIAHEVLHGVPVLKIANTTTANT